MANPNTSHMKKAPTHYITHAQNRGYMLLEILITIGVLAVGLLGVAALQMTSLKTSQSAVQRGEAAIRIAEMTNRMRANPAGIQNGAYNNSSYTSTKQEGTSRAIVDFNAWLDSISDSLGSGASAKIECTNLSSQCLFGIQWDDRRGSPDVNTDNIIDTAELYTYETLVVF